MSKYNFVLPIYVSIPRKTKDDKKIPLTLNWYRNAHHQESNQVKRSFKPLYGELWEGQAPRIKVSYMVQKMTRARYDTMNVVATVDKFFLDWLVSLGAIKDDDCTRVEYGVIKGTNANKKSRCLATVEILQEDPLQIKP